MRASNNIFLLIVLGILVLSSVALSFWEKNGGSLNVDTDLFSIENIEPIDRVVITNDQVVMDCRAFSGGFMINESYLMDENMLTVLAAVLQRVRVERPLSASQLEELGINPLETGSHIEIYTGEQLLSSFWAGGDGNGNSYFATEEGSTYLVHLPGYTSYVSGLFKQPLSQWRSRKVFSNTWRSLMNFSYQDFSDPGNDFEIQYKDPFFAVPGVQQLDSNNVMNYLRDLTTLEAAALIDTSFQGMPWLELTIMDIDPQKNQILKLYGDESAQVILGEAGGQFFTFGNATVEPLLKSASYFER